jgi:hypothetical protein
LYFSMMYRVPLILHLHLLLLVSGGSPEEQEQV